MESLGLRLRLEAANLMRPAACLRDLARPHLGGLVIGHVHHGEPAQKLLGLDIGSVADHHGATGAVGAVDRAVLLQPPRRTRTRRQPSSRRAGPAVSELSARITKTLGMKSRIGFPSAAVRRSS